MKNRVKDITLEDYIEVGDLVLVSKATYNGSPYMEFGVVSRFTPSRVYYYHKSAGHYYRSARADTEPEESWTQKRQPQYFKRGIGYVYHPSEYAELFILERNVPVDALDEIGRYPVEEYSKEAKR